MPNDKLLHSSPNVFLRSTIEKICYNISIQPPVPLQYKQYVALTGRNRTGPPCSVGRLTARAPGGRLAGSPAGSVTDDKRRRQMPATVTSLPPTLCVGGPVISSFIFRQLLVLLFVS